MKPPAILILGETSIPVARQVQMALPEAVIYGLINRTHSADFTYTNFGETVREFFQTGTPIIGICAAGILIRTLAPLLTNKWQEPPVLAIAEDGSAVVPLLGGLQGVNDLARQIASVWQISPAITTTGDIRFKTTLLSPPLGYQLVNPDDAKKFLADLLAGEKVKLIGEADWLKNSNLPISSAAKLSIEIIDKNNLNLAKPSTNCLVYLCEESQQIKEKSGLSPGDFAHESQGKLAIVGTGPGALNWMSPEVREVLEKATDWVGYKTYLDLVESLRKPEIVRHESDNRVELDRAEMALDLAAKGRSVVLVSSGDPGIYAMAAAVFEVLEKKAKPAWDAIAIQVCPGISAMQAAAARVGALLGHDFCAISLSDILKSWQVISQRIELAARADLAIAFYNPVSQERTWQLEKAKEILLQWRSPQTPVVLARNLGRKGETVTVKFLEDMTIKDADMRTIILIGSSKTRLIEQGKTKQWVYTPRHY
ncbi:MULTISPECIES: precorrin-3B C(17)-methyltransferase [unclassified Microcystis]|jgi:cobalt-precorrin 5A hydrolase/precorrin-3B C17-methyltransferase|uniref:precorrin-3B C(17)-methyltransferase n=1 Tax=unclassified Microcystis TaxID=2643300 RepID=UPI00258D6126|nr:MULTISPECIES: precorrin-3B C(17)-methyltransferase [unclassified Microcystis]MCA2764990.1 precorrin-3B C(17)-methyltransferase [Microcystis sp. M151S2]MCA2642352.1 precorrin-3B C(17)-methyltransferase [Microcystis sp. M087S2]MCA2672650.1 precorrin-3B C(17)-methyltransferase [Microcystis sp. M080S2]MCA2690699.1 precorrin-3B C(17)-methyltransferase [Microcystis sp. M037S2]MCA2733425.1 precorrin-3B C(17)-methyltransferase [Microcystis sp. M158S2]